jgi:GAF domain-containing protein
VLIFTLLGALAVTYALLKRRVLDIEFVLSRTLVVATISLIVVAAFVLLEWLLGTVLAGASHATGLVANGLLALLLGLSMDYIHKRVDAFIDTLFFRKRRDDEQALRDFSKEAGYVTDSEALLDQAIAKIERHTDARGAALLLDGESAYAATRAFGNVSLSADENDAAILALKTWHKPLDPHRYATALHGALALPMLVRGQLLGVVLVGERARGEAYAPDEVDALALFSQGVGSALDSLAHRNGDGLRELRESIARIANDVAALRQSLGR